MQSKSYFQLCVSWSKYFLLLTFLFLVACGGGPGGDSGSGSSSVQPETQAKISGVVADGNALARLPVSIQDESGKSLAENCKTDEKGFFDCPLNPSAQAAKNIRLAVADMIALIVDQQAKQIQQNINPLTDYVAREVANCPTTECSTFSPVSKGDYDEAAKETFEKIGTKPSKFLTEPFEARIPNDPKSGSVTDDMLEALKADKNRLDKETLDEVFTEANATKKAPLIANKEFQTRFVVAAAERGAQEEEFKKELNNILGDEINKDIVDGFVGTIEEFRKVKKEAENQLTASNESDLVSAILDLIEIALLKEVTAGGTNKNLQTLANGVIGLLQQPLIDKFEQNKATYANQTDIEIAKTEVGEEIENNDLNTGDVTSILTQGFSDASIEINKWKKLPLPNGVNFAGQGFTNEPQMQNIGIDGNRAVVGDPANNTAYFFEYQGTAWQRVPQNKVDGCYFVVTGLNRRTQDVRGKYGYSVAIDGGAAIVGAPTAVNPYSTKTFFNTGGAACVFTWDSNQWLRGGPAIPFEGAGNLGGYSVSMAGKGNDGTHALDGVVSIMGAPKARISNLDASSSIVGKFYTFIRYGRTWFAGEGQQLPPSPNKTNRRFGSAVSTDGQTAVIGDFQKRGAGSGPEGTQRGGVYFYKRTNPTLSTNPSSTSGNGWTPQGSFVGKDLGSDRLGYAVSVHGDTAVVSAGNRSTKEEYILVLNRTGGKWKFAQQIYLENTVKYAFKDFTSFAFRTSLAIHGDRFIVGIQRPDSARADPNFTQEVRIYKKNTTKTKNPWELEHTFQNRGGRAVAYKGGKFLIASDDAVWSYAP